MKVSRLFFRSMIFGFCVLLFQGLFTLNSAYYFLEGGSYLNIPDHKFYVALLSGEGLEVTLSSINNFVIAFLYESIGLIFPFDYVGQSLFVNMLVLGFAFYTADTIVRKVTGKYLSPIYCIALGSVFQFSVLINKDSFAVLYYLLLVYYFLTGSKRVLVLLLVLCPIRIQLGLVFAFSTFLVFCAKRNKYAFVAGVLLLYSVGAAIATYLESSEVLLDHAGYAEGGVAALISDLNKRYYLGNFLLNVVKPLQYVYDLWRSAIFDGSILGSLIWFFKCVTLFLLGCNAYPIMTAMYMPWRFNFAWAQVATATVVCAFFLVYLISPIVDYRYLMTIIPVMIVLLALRSKKIKLRLRLE